MRKLTITVPLVLLLSCMTLVAHGIEPKTQEVVCKPEHFKCPDGYELDLVVYGCVKIKFPPTPPPTPLDPVCPTDNPLDPIACMCANLTIISLTPLCPPGKSTLNETTCTCDSDSPTSPDPSCPPEHTFEPDICLCQNFIRTPFPPSCPPGNFKLDQITCTCPSKPIPPPCPPGKILDPETRKCVCSQPVKCNPLQKFNKESCECECRKVIIPVAPKRRRPIIADRCLKGAKTNSRCRCVFNHRHY